MSQNFTHQVQPYSLADYGWDEAWKHAFAPHHAAGLTPARISRAERGSCQAITDAGIVSAEIPGTVDHGDPLSAPCTGDWAALRLATTGRGTMLRAVLERRTALVRSTASRTLRGQVLAANIDTVVVTVSLADPLKHGRTDTPDHAPSPDPMTEAFFTLHHGLPRQGPGSDATTRRLLGMAGPLPKHPRVLDAGCGPGHSTLVPAEEAGAHVSAVDLHQPLLDSLTAEAAHRGLLAPHGVLGLTEIEWTVPDPATPVRAYWDAFYPLRTRTANTDAAQAAGFRVRAHSPTLARTGPS